MNAYGRVGSGGRSRRLLVVPVILVALVAGVGLLTASPGDDEGSSPSPSTEAVARVSPTVRQDQSGCSGGPPSYPLAATFHDILDLGPAQVRLSLPAGWCHWSSASDIWAARSLDGGEIGFTVSGPLPCVDGAVLPEYTIPNRAAVMIDSFIGERIEFRRASACHPNLMLDALGDPGGRGPDTALTVWLVDVLGERLAMYAATGPTDARRQAELRRLVESVHISTDPPEEPAEGSGFPGPGELPLGSYWTGLFGWFRVPSTEWVSIGPAAGGLGGSIMRGTVGSPDGAVVRFASPDRVYADPCAGTLGRPVGESVEELASAMAAIPGVDVAEPTAVPLRWSTAQHLVLTLPDDLACDPQAFRLWDDGLAGPRTATAPGSTIRVWIFNPNNRPIFGRIVIEAETYPGVTPEFEREIQQIVASIDHGG